jgi:hypothetical protein
MNSRQRELNWLWAHYRTLQYEARIFDWDGKKALDPLDTEAIASAGFIPPGYYAPGGQMVPLKFRKPTAPYHLVRVITDRFTGLLFSERRHPKLRVEGDPEAEQLVQALARASRLWSHMITARTLGGSMGTFCVGMKYVSGLPRVEVFDPRWVFPEFEDQATFTLASIEQRFQFPVERQDFKGAWLREWWWYRRYIDAYRDVLFFPEPIGEGEEPYWRVKQEVQHGLGFCPVVWGQNLPVPDDVDGDPDCQGIYPITDAIDSLYSQAYRGIRANTDPTVVIKTDLELAELRKGSDNAIKLEVGGDAKYMEISGDGPRSAIELADKFRDRALEIAQCVLEHPQVSTFGSGGKRTATEVQRSYESMYAKADILREQYGELLIKPLLVMMVKAAGRVHSQTFVDETGQEHVQIVLPRFRGNAAEIAARVEESLELDLRWEPYETPTMDDVLKAVQAAAAAKAAGLVGDEEASNFVASLFRVEDVGGMLAKVHAAAKSAQAEMDAVTMAAMATPSEEPEKGP